MEVHGNCSFQHFQIPFSPFISFHALLSLVYFIKDAVVVLDLVLYNVIEDSRFSGCVSALFVWTDLVTAMSYERLEQSR